MSTRVNATPGAGTDGQDDKNGQPGDQKKSLFHRPVVLLTGGLILLVLSIGIFLWWWHARQFQNTDDAFVDARVVRVSPRISGQVIGVHADDNQLVHAGDVLVDIDSADVRAMLDQIRAQQTQAETALSQAQADVHLAEAQYAQAASACAYRRVSPPTLLNTSTPCALRARCTRMKA